MLRETAARLSLALTSFLIAFTLCELLYRAVAPVPSDSTEGLAWSPFSFYEYDARLGWRAKPGAAGVIQRPDYSYAININAHGMRQRPVTVKKQANMFRIAALGDSFLWGVGVAPEQRLSELVEARLPGVEVLNFGICGYAPIQYRLMLDRIRLFQPDLVLLLFCLGNDFADNVLSYRYSCYGPYATLTPAGALHIAGLPPRTSNCFGHDSTMYRWLGSYLLGRVRNKWHRATAPREGLLGFRNDLLYLPEETLTTAERELCQTALAINQALLASINHEWTALGIPLVVIAAPTKKEYSEQWSGNDGRARQVEKRLQATCADLRVPCLTAVDALSLQDFWVEDSHWNADGHRRLAELLTGYLRDTWLERPARSLD